MPNDLAGNWKQSALEEADEPYPEPRDKNIMVLYLMKGLGLIWAGIKMFEHYDSNKQQAEPDK